MTLLRVLLVYFIQGNGFFCGFKGLFCGFTGSIAIVQGSFADILHLSAGAQGRANDGGG